MPTAIKFCGLTRGADAALAESLGARYVGVILAASPRQLTVERAREVLDATHGGAARVGVFAGWDADAIARAADALALDVVQLHGTGEGGLADAVRARTGLPIWEVVHVAAGESTPERMREAIADAARRLRGDATLLDAKVEGMMGGTGLPFDWRAARQALDPLRARGPIILAGGLAPENVAQAIALLVPDVVDVSSGVEASPGIKDEHRMRAFAAAVRAGRAEPSGPSRPAPHAAPGAEQP